VHGTAVPFGPQRYWIVYEWYTEQIMVTYPMGGEGFVPGETELIRWDASGITGTFNVQLSTDGGANWTTIASNLANNVRHRAWTVPNNITGQARIRVVAGSITGESEQNFSISPLVSNLSYSYICPTELGLSWNPVTQATGYIVYRLGQRYMDSIGTTTNTNFVVLGTSPSDTDYFAIAPIGPNNLKGRRSLALAKPLNNTFGCQAAPSAGFVSSVTAACPNQTISLVDQSLNLATSWRWTINPSTFNFVNGTSDTSQAPQVVFTANGSYTIQLIASNTYGSDTITRPNYIVVGNGLTVPQTQTFPGNAAPADWTIENPDNADTWQFRTGFGPGGATTGMAWLNFYSYNAAGQIDHLVSPVIDLSSGVPAPLLTFSVAYAQYSTTLFDGLRIEISSDCGSTYVPSTYFKEGLQLSTAGTLTNTFTPTTNAHWRTDSLDLTPYVGSRIRIRFVGINGYGNNLYLTNFAVTSSTGMVASFTVSGNTCVNSAVNFSSTATGNITSLSWDFGNGATPPTAIGAGPHPVVYASTGSRQVVLTANGPGGSVQATNPVLIEAPATADFSFAANGSSVSFSNLSQNASSLRWEFGDGNTSTQQNPTHNYSTSDIYEVKLIAFNGCENDTITRQVTAFATSVKEVGGLQARLYPNPAAGNTQLDLAGLQSGQPLQLSLLDLQGRVLWKETVAVADERLLQNIALQGFAAGLYQLRVVQADRAMQLPLVKSE
jgi:PKD repeat protein